ncbi:hypothetical protein [Sorangium sp. So ce204]|uniref:hypothetical protein n=1 Tax=Sorangium sp. So ce204 TaxID=3133288 RepID=UPI003F611840
MNGDARHLLLSTVNEVANGLDGIVALATESFSVDESAKYRKRVDSVLQRVTELKEYLISGTKTDDVERD